MLTNLQIRNFAVIKEAELDLQAGMTVITGETGAGKSIIVDTLSLIFGGRAASSLIHPQAQRAEITATFAINNTEISEWLADHEFASDDECIMRRILSSDGKSKSTINGTPCTQQNARELGLLLLNIQGQHEYQNLLKPEKQTELLDTFAVTAQLAATVKQIYAAYAKTQKEIAALEVLAKDRFAKMDFLRYQIQELETLELKNGEIAELHQEHKRLTNAETIIKNCNDTLLLACDGENPLLSTLYKIKTHLEEIKKQDERITKMLELFNTTTIEFEEAILELKNYAAALELNEERLSVIEQRLNTIHELARKHKVKPEELSAIITNLKNELNTLEQAENQLQEMKNTLEKITVDYNQNAKKLSEQRKKAALKLNKIISEKMQHLNMPGGKFSINFTARAAPHPHGLESIEFWVSANPGHPLQPLAKVASGGELSRISLAIQVATAKNQVTPTLIFDEVDVGIGGKTAAIVGEMLKDLGKITQVLCVTHLPQVAALGDQHLQVIKNTHKNTTEVTLGNLTPEERVMEIARMLGGVKITPQTIAHAKEMLNIFFERRSKKITG